MEQRWNRDVGQKVYRTAVYLRISRDDGDKAESDSIANQRKLVEEYARGKTEFCLVDEYVDDGFSGANFERPAFRRLYEDLESGAVNCILVKDLSRFGRNYIEVGRYLERIFPMMGVRLVAINDHYDTASAWENSEALMVPIRNLMNDAYCRDMSVKVKTQLDAKRRRGECVSNYAPYGYKKDPNDRSRLIVDEEAANHVRQIFRWKLDGVSDQGIADRLNKQGVLSPLEYRLREGEKMGTVFRKKEQAQWSCGAVYRILHNETYTGDITQGKWRTLDYRTKERVLLPREQWTQVEGTHGAIIDKEQFAIVQELMERDARPLGGQDTVELFSGFLFCGICGRQLVIQNSYYKQKKYRYYTCLKCKQEGKSPKRARLVDLYQHTRTAIQTVVSYADSAAAFLAKAKETPLRNRNVVRLDQQVLRLQEELERYKSLKEGLYEDYAEGILNREEYLEYVELYSGKIREKAEQLKTVSAEREKALHNKDAENWIQIFRKYQNVESLDRPMLAELLERIILQADGHLEFVFKEQDEIEACMEMLKGGTTNE